MYNTNITTKLVKLTTTMNGSAKQLIGTMNYRNAKYDDDPTSGSFTHHGHIGEKMVGDE